MIDDATAEVARFDAELGRETAPFAAVLLPSESVASSNIENLTASARAIAEAELHPYAGRNASLIVATEQLPILQPLVEAGVLVEFTDKERNQPLDRFAGRAGRRNHAAR